MKADAKAQFIVSETTLDTSEEEQAPVSALRCESASELYQDMSKLMVLTALKPGPDESCDAFSRRLLNSETPEDAVTFTAFALMPRAAIWWGYEAVRTHVASLPNEDAELLHKIAKWTQNPYDVLRWEIMARALYSDYRSSSVYLGLAAGWSGGRVAPNDTLPVPRWRSPQAVGAAVLSALRPSDTESRSDQIGRVLAIAAPMMQGGRAEVVTQPPINPDATHANTQA